MCVAHAKRPTPAPFSDLSRLLSLAQHLIEFAEGWRLSEKNHFHRPSASFSECRSSFTADLCGSECSLLRDFPPSYSTSSSFPALFRRVFFWISLAFQASGVLERIRRPGTSPPGPRARTHTRIPKEKNFFLEFQERMNTMEQRKQD